MTIILYLGGDSYPGEIDLEKRLAQGLGEALALPVITQMSMLRDSELIISCSVAERVNRLDAIAGLFNEPIILVGRSSGARVASYFARHYQSRHHLLAVICLAYPFCPSGQARDPERIAHLADITTPTLIFQGNRDCYGGQEVQQKYPLSPSVQLEMIDADHEFELSPAVFEMVFEKSQEFLRKANKRIVFT
jgi:predicted alpha/beta-hydrolase family hydrolase